MPRFELLRHQHAFIFSDKRFVCLDGAFGNGKSTALNLKLGLHCLNNEGTKTGYFRQEYTDIKRGSLDDWMDLWGHAGSYNQNSHYFTFDNGSKVLFEQAKNKGKLKDHNFSAVVIEQAEEVSSTAFSYLIGRMRRSDTDNSEVKVPNPRGEDYVGSMADQWIGIASNPEGHDWIWKFFIDNDLSDLAVNRGGDMDDDVRITEDDFQYIWADSFSNIENLEDEYVASLYAMPDHMFERYVMGSRDSFEGQIYSMIDPDIHKIPAFEIPKSWPKFLLLDHGVRNPTAAVWVTIDEDNNVIVYREHYKASGDDGMEWVISQHCDAILEAMHDEHDTVCPYKETPDRMLADPAIFDRTLQRDGQHYTIAEEYREQSEGKINFNPWKKANNNEQKLAQINRVSEYLMLNSGREHIVTEESPAPQLYFFDTCTNTFEEHLQFRWKKKAKQLVGDEQNQPEKARNYMDHTVDCICGFIAEKKTGPEIVNEAPPGSFDDVANEIMQRANNKGGTKAPMI